MERTVRDATGDGIVVVLEERRVDEISVSVDRR
jgi:hypothetical protein